MRAAGALVLVLLVAACGGEEAAAPDRSWAREATLAFERGGSIWLVDRDWQAHRLRAGAEPRWSPDGRRLLLLRTGVVVEDIARGVTRRVVDAEAGSAGWTSDGRIAYLADPGQCRLALYTVDPATKNEEIVAARGLCDETFPYAWSPDGSRVAFSSCELAEPAASGRFVCSLVVGDEHGGAQTDLLENVAVTDVAWAPGAGAIAFTAGNRLHVVDLKTRKSKEVVDGGVRDFGWTPDGRWLMYAPAAAGLWRVTPDGERRERLLSRGPYRELAVSPDGKYAAAVAGGDSSQPGLDVIELQDGILVHRFLGRVSAPDWRPGRTASG